MPKVTSVDPTPNENAMKYTIEGKAIESGSATYKVETASENPIANEVFQVPGVASVFLLNDFVTVIKDPAATWLTMRDKVLEAIERV